MSLPKSENLNSLSVRSPKHAPASSCFQTKNRASSDGFPTNSKVWFSFLPRIRYPCMKRLQASISILSSLNRLWFSISIFWFTICFLKSINLLLEIDFEIDCHFLESILNLEFEIHYHSLWDFKMHRVLSNNSPFSCAFSLFWYCFSVSFCCLI